MAIVVIKVGDSENSSYSKYDEVCKHWDVISLLARHKISAGLKGNKYFFVINVNMDSLSDTEYRQLQVKLGSAWYDKNDNFVAKKLYQVDVSQLSLIGIDGVAINTLNTEGVKRTNKQDINMTSFNNFFAAPVPYSQFIKVVKNKKTGLSLGETL